MRFRILGCSGGQFPGHKLSSFLVGDSLLIDAGGVTASLGIEAQLKLRNILITHAHLDHILGLATLSDNLFGKTRATINVWTSDEVIATVKSSFFNDALWPDFTQITGNNQPYPVLTFQHMPEEEPIPVGNHTLTMVRVNHIVRSSAFFVENTEQTLLHVGDTGPTERVWTLAKKKKNLCAVVLEASFPNRLQDLADLSRHLTPRALERELRKLGRPSIPILVTHLKPQYRDEIVKDLKRIKGYKLRVLNDDESLRL